MMITTKLNNWDFLIVRFMIAIMICCLLKIAGDCASAYVDNKITENNLVWQQKYENVTKTFDDRSNALYELYDQNQSHIWTFTTFVADEVSSMGGFKGDTTKSIDEVPVVEK